MSKRRSDNIDDSGSSDNVDSTKTTSTSIKPSRVTKKSKKAQQDDNFEDDSQVPIIIKRRSIRKPVTNDNKPNNNKTGGEGEQQSTTTLGSNENKNTSTKENSTFRLKKRILNKKPDENTDDEDMPKIYIRRVPYKQPQPLHSTPNVPMTKTAQIKKKITESKMPEKVKEEALLRLKNVDSDKPKQMEWFDSLIKIPFGIYSPLPVTKQQPKPEIYDYFKKVQDGLDKAVYGLDTVKEEITNYIAQFITTESNSMPRVIGLHGSAGTGKTSLIRRGLADALSRPMKTISMGGIRDSSHFVGFDYTYSGSRHGILLQSIMDSGVMNPIIFMDELDKISQNNDGIEVQNLLIHLTDPMQNSTFQDKYFAGIEFDLSKVIFVFAFNDESLIHPILKDRLHIIRIPDPTLEAKIIIGKQFLTKELSTNLCMKPEDITFSDEVIKTIIQNYCATDKGVRSMKRCIESIMLKINAAQYLGDMCKYKSIRNKEFPIEVTPSMVKELLTNEENKDDKYLSSLYI